MVRCTDQRKSLYHWRERGKGKMCSPGLHTGGGKGRKRLNEDGFFTHQVSRSYTEVLNRGINARVKMAGSESHLNFCHFHLETEHPSHQAG